MAERGDLTLQLEELRKALLEPENGENEQPLWNNISPGDDSFLRLASSIDVDRVLETITNRATHLRNELAACALALAPAASAGSEMAPFATPPTDAVETLQALKTELDRCSNDLVATNSLAHFEASELEMRQSREARLKRLETLLDALTTLSQFQLKGHEFDNALENGDVLKAADHLLIIEELASNMAKVASSTSSGQKSVPQGNNLAASRVAKAARSQTRTRRASLTARLDECLVDAFVFDAEKRTFTVSLETHSDRMRAATRLEGVIEAFGKIGGLTTRIQERAVKPIMTHMVEPLVKGRGQFKLESDASSSQVASTLRLIESGLSVPSAPLSVLASVQVALRFIWSEVLNRNTSLNSDVNAYVLIEPSLRMLMRQAVPETFAELEVFTKESLDLAAKFDQEVTLLGFKGHDKLASFVADAEANFGRKLRERYAEKIRMAAKNDLYTYERVNAQVEPDMLVGKSEFSIPEEMKISKFARIVVRSAEQALLEASDTKSQISREALIKASRTCFDMFRAMAGPLRTTEMTSNPRCAAVHRNDCDYLGRHLVFLAHRFKNETGLRDIVFVDLAPYLFDEGDETLRGEIEIRCRQVQDLFSVGESRDASAIDFSSVLSRSDSIVQAWTDTLPVPLLEKSKQELGEALSNGVFSALCGGNVNVLGLAERRTLLKKLSSFGDAIKSRGGSSRKVEQMCKALQPHMSLFPLFADLVETELQDWPPENLVAFSYAVFGKVATKEELKKFEEKILFY